MDLYSLFGFVNPGMLGSTEHYRRQFATPIKRDADPSARARLRRVIAPFVLRRLKTEVLDDLPPRTEIVLHVEMSPEETALYEALRRRAVDDLESLMAEGPGAGEGRLEILAHLTRCGSRAAIPASCRTPAPRAGFPCPDRSRDTARRHRFIVMLFLTR